MALSPSDQLFLRQAIELAEGGRFTCAPNPCVGCVIVRHGQVLGRGFHQRAGQGHAEVNAIEHARSQGHAVAGSTVYVSLEPCAFVGRTPACAATLVQEKVARVVVAMRDPHPKVAGAGIAMLQDAGIEVSVVEDIAAHRLVRGYVKRVTAGLPWVRLKSAASLDGAVALSTGESKWITGAAARRDVQYWRARSDAIITGIGTVLADDPSLTVREEDLLPADQPLRVVLDRHLRTPESAGLVNDGGKTLLCHGPDVDIPSWLLKHPQVQLNPLVAGDAQTQLRQLLLDLAEIGCNEVMVEAGPGVCGSFANSNLWDEWISYIAPKWLGHNSQGLASFTVERLRDAPAGKVVDVAQFGEDVRLILEQP